MATSEFDTRRRRNGSGYRVLIWAVGIGYAVAVPNLTGLTKFPFLFVSAFAVWRLIIHSQKAVAFYLQKRRLNQAAVVPKLSLETLSKNLKSSHLYLGRGFIWHQPHAQKAFEILKGPLAELVETKQASLGAVWIHGIGAKEEEEIYFPIAHSEGHTLILGTTGSGKTTLFRLLIAQAILRGESVLIIDPKGDREMLEIAKETSKMVGRAFYYFHPAYPKESIRLDPLHSFSRASELASRLAALIPSETGSDPFKAFSQKSLDNIVQAILTLDSRPTLLKLRRYLESGAAGLIIQALGKHLDKLFPDWREKVADKNQEEMAYKMIRYYRQRVQGLYPALSLEGAMSLYEHDRMN
jgi:conjugal transfer pilus assembly protein TraD